MALLAGTMQARIEVSTKKTADDKGEGDASIENSCRTAGPRAGQQGHDRL
jgi:hypothetical protein